MTKKFYLKWHVFKQSAWFAFCHSFTQFPAELVTFTGEVLNGKLHFFMPWYLRLVLSNLPNCKLSSKVKILKFGIKKCFIWVFWVMVLNSYCHICHSSHICHIARSLQFCLMTMFQVKIQTLKSGTKNGYFWDRILKYYCHIWN